MGIQAWTFVIVGITFAIYIGIAIRSRVKDTAGFYVAGQGISALGNGMATAADWMSAASFISMAGLIAFMGYDGTIYLMGWTGGYVLLALLLAPFLRKFGKYTVPDFVGDRYYSNAARVVAVVAAIWVSLRVGRIVIFFGVLVAGYFGIRPPGFVAEVVAFAFGLAAASFFPVLVLGIFWKRANKEGAICGMLSGLGFTAIVIALIRSPQIFGTAEPLITDFFGVNAQGVGAIGMLINFVVTIAVSLVTPPPPLHVQEMVEGIRYPRVRSVAERVDAVT